MLNYFIISPCHYFNNKVANQLKQSIYFPGDFVTLDCRILANGLRLSLSVSFWILLDRAVGTEGQGENRPTSLLDLGRPVNPIPTGPHFLKKKAKFTISRIFRPSDGPVAQRRKLAFFGLSSRIYKDTFLKINDFINTF